MPKLRRLLIALALLAAARPAAAEGGFVVIVNNSVSQSSLPVSQTRDIFFGKTTTWNDGSKAQPVDQTRDSSARVAFSDAVLGKSVSAVLSHWQQEIFSGRGVPPPELGSDAEVVAYVRRVPGAIGYVSAGTDVSGVRTLPVR